MPIGMASGPAAVAPYISPMRMLILSLLLAATLAACGDIPIGPVDHSCLGNPQRGALDSGCDRGGLR
jgi:hypothetical protein